MPHTFAVFAFDEYEENPNGDFVIFGIGDHVRTPEGYHGVISKIGRGRLTVKYLIPIGIYKEVNHVKRLKKVYQKTYQPFELEKINRKG